MDIIAIKTISMNYYDISLKRSPPGAGLGIGIARA